MKKNEISLDRREFTLAAALAALSGATITISACGGSSPSSGTPPPTNSGNPGDHVGTVSANHVPGHVAMVTAAQLVADNLIQVNIQGQADHNHVITLNSTALTAIKNGGAVATDSTNSAGSGLGDHHHTVTFNIDAGPPTRY